MKPRRVRHHGESVKVNVTPLIDVVMCLIIFFLIVGKLAADRAAELDLPMAASGREPEGEPLVINLLKRPSTSMQVVIEGVEVSVGGVEAAAQAALRERARQIVLRADRALEFEQVRPVLEACRRAGATSVRLATEDL